MLLLRDGVPLTLLIDLVDPWGPPSADIYAEECGLRTIEEPSAPTLIPDGEQVTPVSCTPKGSDGSDTVNPKPWTGSDRPATRMP